MTRRLGRASQCLLANGRSMRQLAHGSIHTPTDTCSENMALSGHDSCSCLLRVSTTHTSKTMPGLRIELELMSSMLES
eukprot:272854-Chlamydomonas_euryale.AAC.6